MLAFILIYVIELRQTFGFTCLPLNAITSVSGASMLGHGMV